MKPKTVPEGGDAMDLYELAHGVFGYAIESGGKIYIPFIQSREEGKGNVSRFIDSLDSNCVFPNLISEKLKMILIKKGWKLTYEHSDKFGDVDVWIHPMVRNRTA